MQREHAATVFVAGETTNNTNIPGNHYYSEIKVYKITYKTTGHLL